MADSWSAVADPGPDREPDLGLADTEPGPCLERCTGVDVELRRGRVAC